MQKKILKSSLTILLASFVLSWLYFLFSLVFTLNFNKYGCNGEEEEMPYFTLKIIYVFVHALQACYGHSNIALRRRMGEFRNFELDLREYGA